MRAAASLDSRIFQMAGTAHCAVRSGRSGDCQDPAYLRMAQRAAPTSKAEAAATLIESPPPFPGQSDTIARRLRASLPALCASPHVPFEWRPTFAAGPASTVDGFAT